MNSVRYLMALCVMFPLEVTAQQTGLQDELLDRLVGEWVMQGTIAGDEVTHDLDIEWVLGHNYVRIHEVARERTPEGEPAYEAIVLIGWLEPTQRYACLWLDTTGGGGLVGEGIGHAVRAGDSLPFVWDLGDGSGIHNTFAYDRENDMWRWSIDNERDGERSPFARVTLTRRGDTAGRSSRPAAAASPDPGRA